MQERAEVKVAIDVDALGDQIAEMSAHIDAAMHRLLTAIREFDIAAGWQVQGALSCAHWLAWRVGWDLRTARERVRVARKLAELPLIDEELRRGAMSYSQARALTRVATAENEKLWVEYAKHMPASQLDTLCRSYQNVQAYDQAHGSEAGAMAGAVAAAHVAAQRTVTRRSLDNGMVKFEIVVASDEAAIVWAALNAGIAKAGAAPTTADSLVAEPSTAEPSTAEPSTAEPSTAEPSTAEPSTAEPSRADQTPAEPRSAEPSTAEPSRADQTPAEPRSAEPSTAEPSTAEPSTAEPSTAEPSTAEPSRADQAPAELRAAEPSTAEPSTAEPTRADQAPAEPRSAEPSRAEHSNAAQAPAEHSFGTPPIAKAPSSADRGRQRADAFMDIIQDRMRGNRPQRTPIEIIITVPHAGLHGSAEPSDLAMMAGGEVIATTTARRLCCDAGVVVAHVDAHGQPLSIGRKTRTISAAIKRALRLRDRTCRFPGCTHSRYVDGHHIEHWAYGGETALSNLMLLCSAHHTLLHEGGCRVEANSANGWDFFDHRNRRIEAQPSSPASSNFSARHGC